MRLLMRDEARATERRAPLTPDDAAGLIAKAGIEIHVERSAKRVFSDAEYAAAGCALAAPGAWRDAAPDTVILGLKELPETPAALRNPMIHFSHSYKGQTGWRAELARYRRGGGALYDIEYLTDADGRRVAAFGYWAGWMGAALALWRLLARDLDEPGPEAGVASFVGRDEVADRIRDLAARHDEKPPRAVVIGALGRSGRGAADALALAAEVTRWDMAETADLDRKALLGHDILVNCVLMTGPGLRLVAPEDLRDPGCALRVMSDVSCDPLSDFNPLPLYRAPTSWNAPFLALGKNGRGGSAELTAIDNLPSLIPLEASEDFSTQLATSIARYDSGHEWGAARAVFERKLAESEA